MNIPIEDVYEQIRQIAEKFDLFSDALNEDLWSLLELDIINMDHKNVSPDLISEIERDGVILYEKI